MLPALMKAQSHPTFMCRGLLSTSFLNARLNLYPAYARPRFIDIRHICAQPITERDRAVIRHRQVRH